MDIRYKDFSITADERCFQLRDLRYPSVDKRSGEVRYPIIGYYTELEHALLSIAKHIVMRSDASELHEAVRLMVEAREELKAAVNGCEAT